MEYLKRTDQFQGEKWLILAIGILVKLNLRIKIMGGICEKKAVEKSS